MRLPGQLPLEQAQVAELARLRVLMQAAVLGLAQGRESAWQQELAAVPVPARQQELAAALEQVRELWFSRQLELQQHRLQAAAQELPPYLPALPMKALC